MCSERNATTDSLTECHICKKDCSDPRILPCIHTFCLKCLENYRRTSSADGDIMRCPFCQKEFPKPEKGFIGVKKNFFLERLVRAKTISNSHANDEMCGECFEDSELTDSVVPSAVQYCVQCSQFLCKACSRIHRRNRLSKDHSLIDLGTESIHVYELLKINSGTIPCDKHSGEQLQMFCTDCQKFACATCLDEDHQQHTIRSIKRIADDYQNQLEQMIDDVTSCVTGAEKKIQMLVEEMADFQRNTDDCEKKILGAIEELKRLVDVQGKVLIDELLSTKQRQLKVLQNEVKELQTHRKLLDHFKNYCSEVKTKSTKIDLCDSFIDLSRRAEEFKNICNFDMLSAINFVEVSIEETPMSGNNIVGKIKETVKDLSMRKSFRNTIAEDLTNNQTQEFCCKLALITIDREKLEPTYKLVQNLHLQLGLPVAHSSIHVSKITAAADENIAGTGSAQPAVQLEQIISQACRSAVDFQNISKLTASSDRRQISTHSPKLLHETSSSLQRDNHDRIVHRTEVDCRDGPCLNEPNEDDLIKEVIGTCTADGCYSNARTGAVIEHDCIDLKVKEVQAGNTAVSENSLSHCSSVNLTRSLHSSDYGRFPITNVTVGFPEVIYIDNDLKEEASENTEVRDYTATKTQLVLDCFPESPFQIPYAEELRNSSQSLTDPDLQRNKDEVLSQYFSEADFQEGCSGLTFNNIPIIGKAWSMQDRSHQPDADLGSLGQKLKPSTGDELHHLDIEEIAQRPRCDTDTNVDQMESELEETQFQPHASHFPQKKFVNATSQVSLRLVFERTSDAEIKLSTDEAQNNSNLHIEAADPTQSLKRKLKTSEPQQKHASKIPKGNCALELIHKIKTGSTEVFGVTSLQNKVYILRKKSVSIYSIEDPNQPLTSIKLQDAITPFDICACKKSFAIYITDYGNYDDDREKHCIWKITVPVTDSEHNVSRWYCGIGEPYTLSVNNAGNVVLLRIEADSQQITLEILSDKAELIRSIPLPEEIEQPEHALETSTGNFVICHKRNGYEIWTVSEVNKSGEIIRRLKGTEQLSEPKHLALDAEDRVFVADWRNNRVAILDARFKGDHIFFENKEDDKDGLLNPTRLCYVAEKRQLIVVSNSLKVCVYRVVLN